VTSARSSSAGADCAISNPKSTDERSSSPAPRELKRAFPNWLMFSLQATYDRKRPGKEQTLYRRKADLIDA
jgi:hypothetical protein